MSEAKDDGMTAEERTNWLRERVSSGERVGGNLGLDAICANTAISSPLFTLNPTFLTLNSVGSPY